MSHHVSLSVFMSDALNIQLPSPVRHWPKFPSVTTFRLLKNISLNRNDICVD